MTVTVGTLNPGKVQAVRTVFQALHPDLPVRGVQVASGVPEQPIGFTQTRRGAVNRARAALREPGTTWALGLEGGVRFQRPDEAWLFGIVAVTKTTAYDLHTLNPSPSPSSGASPSPSSARSPTRTVIHTARSAELRLPARVARRIQAGEELGPIMDDLLGTHDIKKGIGTVGAFTHGLTTRPQIWQQTITLALAPLLVPELYE